MLLLGGPEQGTLLRMLCTSQRVNCFFLDFPTQYVCAAVDCWCVKPQRRGAGGDLPKRSESRVRKGCLHTRAHSSITPKTARTGKRNGAYTSKGALFRLQNGILKRATTWMNLRTWMLSERSQPQKDILQGSTHMRYLLKCRGQ